MYLCRVSYSLPEMVYRRALRRIGSAVDFAEIRGPFEPSGAGDVMMVQDRGIWTLLGNVVELV